MMTVLFSLLLSLLSSNTSATSLVVMEQTKTSRNTIFIDTTNARVGISTQSYNGKVVNVGLYSSSNVVVSNTNKDNCVLYATGSVSCLGATLTGGSGGSFVQKVGDTMTGQLTVSNSSLTVSGGGGLLLPTGPVMFGNDPSSTMSITNNAGNDFSVRMATASSNGGTGGSIFECGMHFNGSGSRLACDLQRPSNYPPPYVVEFTVPYATTSATAASGQSWTVNGFRSGYNIFHEASGGGASLDFTLGAADHNNLGNARGGNGTDRAGIILCGYDNPACGPFQSVCIGCYAATNNEALIDTRPIAGLTVRPPDWPTASNGFGDSPPFILGGVSYDGSAHRLSWQQYVRATSNAGASLWVLGNQDITVNGSGADAIPKISTFVVVKDNGSMSVGNPALLAPAYNLDVQGTLGSSGLATLNGVTVTANSTITLSGATGNFVSASSVTASAFFGDGSHLTGIAASFTKPTVQTFTSGSGTYSRPAGVLWVHIRMVGGGAGGAGSGAGGGNGTGGGNTTFGTSLLTAGGGAVAAGAGGTVTGCDLNITGGQGEEFRPTGGVGEPGSTGGVSAFGGNGFGGTAAAGHSASPNSGSGGAGGGATAAINGAPGGSAGGYCDAVIINPSSSYSYAVGAAGTAGTAGTGGSAGGAGGAGVIIVEEHYN